MAEKAVNAYAENGGSKYVMNKKANGTYERKKISFDSDAIESLETNALPKVTGSDNGKALIVSSGKWAKKNIPSQLPAVTGSDEGKVLTVDSSGDWIAAAAGGGGGGVLSVTVTYELVDYTETYTMNKTFAEIKAALISGTPVIVHVDISGTDNDGENDFTYENDTYYNVSSIGEYYINDVFESASVKVDYLEYTVSNVNDYPVATQS